MKILLGLQLGGATFGPHADEDAATAARIGEPTWGPSALLRDLELRLGLPRVDEAPSVRIPRYKARIEALAKTDAFYAKSFAVDALGTATTLLDWRDALVEAGWDGEPIPNGGDRLDALAALEAHADPLPLGRVDRLVRVLRTLPEASARIYDEIALVDDRALWSQRWQSVFDGLAASGTRFTSFHPTLPSAPADSDLGILQAHLRNGRPTTKVRGDGTLLMLRGDTSIELAELTAAVLAHPSTNRDTVIVRPKDHGPLETALARYGLPSQGHAAPSSWRPAMQILPLAVELAFEPRDPYRVLELLTLPEGPFRGRLGRELAKAVAREPGVGGRAWTRNKARALELMAESSAKTSRDEGKSEEEAERRAADFVAERTARVAAWIETPGAGPEGASRAALLAVAERVKSFLQARMAKEEERPRYVPAHAQAAAFLEAILHDTRAVFPLEEARHMLDRLARAAHAHPLSIEECGRIPHVAHPGALLASTDTLVFWSFVSGTELRPRLLPWNKAERAALEAAGITHVEPRALLTAEAKAWRDALLAARTRVLLVVPSSVKGEATSPHPLWDEITARLNLDERTSAKLTVTAHALLDQATPPSLALPVETLPPLLLPEPRGTWQIAPDVLAGEDEHGASATSIEKLATCPLSWVLEQRAKLRRGAIAKVADKKLLNGNLSHRLVEELHLEGAFDEADDAAFLARVATRLEALLRTEATTLLLPGASMELVQLRSQITRAMRELRLYLRANGYRIAGVEEHVHAESAVGTLHGRLDVRLVDAEGRSAVLDLKWGRRIYETRLKEGRAVQLAAYARSIAKAANRTTLPPAGYYAVAKGEVLSADPRMKASRPVSGPSLDETWSRVETTAKAVLDAHAKGTVFVTGTQRSLPLLDALGVPDEARPRHYATGEEGPCTYCGYGAICGRAWEVLA